MEYTTELESQVRALMQGQGVTPLAMASVRALVKWPGGESYFNDAVTVATVDSLRLISVQETGTLRKRTKLDLAWTYEYSVMSGVGVNESAARALVFSVEPQEFFLFPLVEPEQWERVLTTVAEGVHGPEQSANPLKPERGVGMTTWTDLQNYVRGKYEVSDEDAQRMTLRFDVGEGRTQLTYLFLQSFNDGQEWVSIESPIGTFASIDMSQLLASIGNMVAGGVSILGDVVTLKHCVPIRSLDAESFERPMQLITVSADRLEQQLVGGDTF